MHVRYFPIISSNLIIYRTHCLDHCWVGKKKKKSKDIKTDIVILEGGQVHNQAEVLELEEDQDQETENLGDSEIEMEVIDTMIDEVGEELRGKADVESVVQSGEVIEKEVVSEIVPLSVYIQAKGFTSALTAYFSRM